MAIAKANQPWAYNGNAKIKRAGYPSRLTPGRREEMIKCMNDPIYFCRNYINIRDVDKGSVKFDMYDFQEDIVNMVNDNRFTIITCARQVGKTTVIMAYIAWYAIFHAKKNVAILANKGKTAYGIMRKFKEIWENIPLWMQQGVEEWNKSTCTLENGTIVYTTATSGDAVRGDSISLCMIDEAAFVKEELWQDFWDSTLPTISSGKSTKLVLISTPNGVNHYEKIYTDAHTINPKTGSSVNGFVPMDVPWYKVPGRDEQWKQEQIAKTSVSRFMQEFELSFLGSDDTLISIDALAKLDSEEPQAVKYKGFFKQYEMPHFSKKYVACVDVSHGVGLDYSVITILDVSREDKYKVVAIYRDNKTTHTVLANLVNAVCSMYNQATVIIENNDMGSLVAYQLNEMNYPNMYNADSFEDQGGKDRLGVRTTTTTKRIGCNNLKNLIENQKLDIPDEDTIREFSNFAKTKKGTSYEAKYGNDDLVMTLVMFAWAVKQNNFIEFTGLDMIDEVDNLTKEEMAAEFEQPVDIYVPDAGGYNAFAGTLGL